MANSKLAADALICESVFKNPLILDSIFENLTIDSLSNCRLVNRLWHFTATTAVRKCFQARLLLCADPKCTNILNRLIATFKNGSIPHSKALLLLDHLPPICEDDYKTKLTSDEVDLMVKMYEALSSIPRDQMPISMLRRLPVGSGQAMRAVILIFGPYVEDLIINMTLQEKTSTNMNLWLKQLSFSNLTEINFHITRSPPEDLSHESLVAFMNSLPNLKSFVLRKLSATGDKLMNDIIGALVEKSNLATVKNMSLEVFTDDNTHLELLLRGKFQLRKLNLIYMGGEIRFTNKIDLIKQFLSKLANSLEYLCTHLSLFSTDERFVPRLPFLKALEIEKVYREFSTSRAPVLDFNFGYYYRSLEKIVFKDLDIWKSQILKAFPMVDVIQNITVQEISLPDLCFDFPLMQRYLKKFPTLKKLNIVLSHVSKYQKECVFCLIYPALPYLKELNISVYDVDIDVYDELFTGLSQTQMEQLTLENRNPVPGERGPNITMLRELEILKIRKIHGFKDLGLTDFLVKFGLMEMASLRYLYIGTTKITPKTMSDLAENVDITIWHKPVCDCPCCIEKAQSISLSTVPEKRHKVGQPGDLVRVSCN